MTSEKELNKAYTFGHNRGVKAYYNEQLCTVELPEAVFEYILSLVPTEETEREPCDDAISREAVLQAVSKGCQEWRGIYGRCEELINALPSVTQKSGKCKDCKYFEYDSVKKVDGVPLIVAHEICSKWGDGCKTREDGYCFLFEPQESEDKE